MSEQPHISKREREIMEHALGIQTICGVKKKRGDRNSFVTGEGDDWAPIQRLVECGLMAVRMQPSELSGGMTVFAVTEKGSQALTAEPKP